jgi:hypothetical protein
LGQNKKRASMEMQPEPACYPPGYVRLLYVEHC